MKTKKIFAYQLLLAIVVMLLLLGVQTVYAQEAARDPIDELTEIIDKTELPRFEGRPHALSSTEPGAEIITTVIFQIIDFTKYLLGGIAILYVTLLGIKLITASDQIDEVSEKAKEGLKYILYGLVLVIVADAFVQQVIFGDFGECIGDQMMAEECAKQGSLQIRGIYNFVEIFVGSVAVLMFVMAGFRLATSAGDEDVISKQKRRIAVALVGIIIIGISEFVIKDVIFPDAGKALPDVGAGQVLVFKLANFAASFIGTLATIFFIYGGYLYIFSRGEEENLGKAKKIMLGAVIGILIAFAAYGIVRTVTRIEPREGEPIDQITDPAR